MDCVAGIKWNGWPEWNGIHGRDRLEYAIGGSDVLISGFGKFNVTNKRPRRGRNPQTGEALILDARRVVTFKPSGVLRDKVNCF